MINVVWRVETHLFVAAMKKHLTYCFWSSDTIFSTVEIVEFMTAVFSVYLRVV